MVRPESRGLGQTSLQYPRETCKVKEDEPNASWAPAGVSGRGPDAERAAEVEPRGTSQRIWPEVGAPLRWHRGVPEARASW